MRIQKYISQCGVCSRREAGRYNKQKSNVSTVAFWYQREPHAPFPSLTESKDLVME